MCVNVVYDIEQDAFLIVNDSVQMCKICYFDGVQCHTTLENVLCIVLFNDDSNSWTKHNKFDK